MFRPLLRYQRVIDVVVAIMVTGVLALFTVVPDASPWIESAFLDPAAATGVALALTVVFGGALAIRRLSPSLALAVAWFAAVAQMLCGLPPLPTNLVIFAVLYTSAAYGTRRIFWAGFASAIGGGVVVTAYLIAPTVGAYGIDLRAIEYFVAVMLAAMFGLGLAWTTGALVRTALRARENRRAQEIAEATAAAEAERVRIARDMHDVVAHSLAVVIAQADGARYAQGREAAAAERALATISTTARAALSDVRMLLTQLRSTEAEGPQPQLADLEQLYAQVRTAGVELRVDVDPAPPPDAPAAVQLAVYRILQEALTNALRHGRGAVDIGLAWQADRVDLLVRNPVSPHAHDDAQTLRRGHGVIGMRERAQLVGGTLSATAESGVFVVRATLPMGAS